MSQSAPNGPLSFDVDLERKPLWFGTLVLYDDHLKISGWSWTGPLQETIRFEHIPVVERWSTPKQGPNFIIHRTQGSALHCRVGNGAFYLANAFKEDATIKLKRRH
jgi:hypothetical protein